VCEVDGPLPAMHMPSALLPCTVAGSAIAKSGKPRSKDHVAAALDELLSLVPTQPTFQKKQQQCKQQR
jgi:hypothetical protein